MIFLLFGFYTASSSSSSSRFWYNALSSRFWRIVSNYISFLSWLLYIHCFLLLDCRILLLPLRYSLPSFVDSRSFLHPSSSFFVHESNPNLYSLPELIEPIAYPIQTRLIGGCEILLFLWISLAFFQNVLFHLLQSLIHSYSSFLF